MKILFISNGYENLGIEYISAVLKKHYNPKLLIDPCLFQEDGFWDIKFLSNIFNYKKIITEKVQTYNPDFILFSVMTDTYQWAIKLSREIKKIMPQTKIIFGGIHPTILPYETIKEKSIDAVVVGEGELTIIPTIETLISNKTYILNGVLYKKDGKILGNPVPSKIADIDKLPFPDKDIFYSQYPFYKFAYLTSISRGCPYSCTYCCNNTYKNLYKEYFRYRELSNVIKELSIAKEKYRPKFIHFTDDTLNFDKQYINDFLKIYKEKISIPFSCYLYPLENIDSSIFKKLKEAGCFKIQIGMQRYDEDKRKRTFKRYTSNTSIKNIIELSRKYKIFIVSDNIINIYDETEEELENLINFYNRYTPNLNEVFNLRYYPKTEITNKAIESNILTEKQIKLINNGMQEKGGLIKVNEKQIYSQFLLLLPVIPRFLRNFITKTKIYKKFPTFNISTRILVRILSKPKYDFYTEQFIRKYFFFIKEIILYKLHIKNNKNNF